MPAASPGARPGGSRPGSGRVFYGWTVVAAAFFVLFMAYGTQYAFGVFFAALVDEFGWSRASLSGVFSLYAAVYSGFALVAGPAHRSLGTAHRHRDRRRAARGGPRGYVPCHATVVRWFTRRRGLAVGLASAGGSLRTFVLPPVAHFLVSRLGWRWSYVVFGTRSSWP